LLVWRQILFAQAYPAAPGGERGLDNVVQRAPGLLAIGNEKKMGAWELHLIVSSFMRAAPTERS
jgi:hypothetical protein